MSILRIVSAPNNVLPCEANPCQNNGVCTNVNGGGFKCTCKDGFGGLICDKKDALHASLILDNHPNWVTLLKQWLPAKHGLQLCYRASKHGFASSTFHSLCDHRGPTVTLVRTGFYVFGGFTDQSWGGSARYIRSTNSFLFSFRNKYNIKPFKLPVYRNHNNAIYTNNGYGPTFGGGHDLHIRTNANANAGSYTNLGHTYKPPSGYNYGASNTRALLAGHYNNFRVNEIEVYYYHQ
ncbi:TLD domain-containing protein 1-like [Dendronephthya gigantea]|uniref:TLD domain-containing protein 1-like n=1 Tax=Dendronephthya gigantea TaxID=151771 RepID=UPI00106A101E|nr:TLD domain-containing protein 1-like [Dendronephthya gigantea]